MGSLIWVPTVHPSWSKSISLCPLSQGDTCSGFYYFGFWGVLGAYLFCSGEVVFVLSVVCFVFVLTLLHGLRDLSSPRVCKGSSSVVSDSLQPHAL